MDESVSSISPERKGKTRRGKPKTWVDASDGSERPTRIGKKYVVDEKGEVSYKRVKSAQLSQSIQLGIRTMVASITSKKGRDLLHTDFSEVESRYFPSSGSSNTVPHHNSDFKFYSYAPYAFRLFREHFGINTAEFMLSLCDKPLIPLSNPGASGSVFYLSYDDTFIIKTVQKNEHNFMMRLLPGYYMNLVQNKKTLLPKFFGLFCYQNSLGKNIRFIVMNNLTPSRLTYFRRFDLKGSTKGRTASENERRKKTPTYKDLDFVELHKEGFVLSQATYDRLKETLNRDVLVLESFRIMDYSMFVGVHRIGIDEVKADRIDTDSDYTDGEDDAASAPTLLVRSNAVTIKMTGFTGDLAYINAVYEQLADGQVVHGRPAFKRITPVPTGTGAMSGSPLYLHFNSDLNRWRMSSALDRPNMTILLMSTPGEYNSPLDVPQGCWQVLGSEGGHTIDSNVVAQVAEDADMASVRRLSKDDGSSTHRRRRSMSFGTITEQLDLTTQQNLNHSIENDDPDDIYAGGLKLKIRDSNGKMVDAVAYLGIIDILQNFRLAKRLEHRFKKIMYDGDACSVHNPNFYRKRFSKFLCGETEGVFRPASETNKPQEEKKEVFTPRVMSGIQNPHFSHDRRGSLASRSGSNASSSSAARRAARGKANGKGSSLRQSSPANSIGSSDDDDTSVLPSRDSTAKPEKTSAGPAVETPDLGDLNVSNISGWSEPPSNTASPIEPFQVVEKPFLNSLRGSSITDKAEPEVLPPIRGSIDSRSDASDEDAIRLKSEIALARAARKSKRSGSGEHSPTLSADAERDLDEFKLLEKQYSGGDTDVTVSSPPSAIHTMKSLNSRPASRTPGSRQLPKTPTKMTML